MQDPGKFHTRPAIATSCADKSPCQTPSCLIHERFNAVSRPVLVRSTMRPQLPLSAPRQMRQPGCRCSEPSRSHPACTCRHGKGMVGVALITERGVNYEYNACTLVQTSRHIVSEINFMHGAKPNKFTQTG